LEGKAIGKQPTAILRTRWKGNAVTDLKEIGCEAEKRIENDSDKEPTQ
jgi:hypothetical protein